MARKKDDMDMKEENKSMSEPKARIQVGIAGDPASFVESRGMTKVISAKPDEVETEEMVSPAILINRLDHNMVLSYGGEAMMIPPRGRRKIANTMKLGGLPKGIQLVPVAKS